ncbi:hypothetical protein [Nonomuraea salmonea]|uniref:hypothetical protein n=1 Tax=Nonomuraea salmonea TaxID=46181 RepID=UPI002FE76B4C
MGFIACICAGVTQASAVLVTLEARPTMVKFSPSLVWTAAPTMSLKSGSTGRLTTISPGLAAQRPAHRSTWSTGPPGPGRPTTVSGPDGRLCRVSATVSTLCPYGPAAASTPGLDAVSASRASGTSARSKVTTTWGPRCSAKVRSNGPDEASSRPSATTIATVEHRTTTARIVLCSRRRRTAASAMRITTFMGSTPACAPR